MQQPRPFTANSNLRSNGSAAHGTNGPATTIRIQGRSANLPQNQHDLGVFVVRDTGYQYERTGSGGHLSLVTKYRTTHMCSVRRV
jgi:hypothetical protein